jgi:acetoin utilization deacetylase AcuC-like enzyme
VTTRLYMHPACREHDPGPHHPERPDRLAAIEQAFAALPAERFERATAPAIELDLLELAHPAAHIERVMKAIPETGYGAIDADTGVSAGSREAALRAAGAAVAAVDAVAGGEADNAFCAVRPPGHHAEPDRAMGFCLFNNVAIAGLYARQKFGFGRIAVVDFDVHHGNGTQAVFEGDPDLFYASTHQWPLYPGTGAPTETGVNRNVVNAILPPMAGSDEFRAAIRERVIPGLERFRPDFLLISAGFDGHRDDPLAMLNLVEDDYAWATRQLCSVAAGFAGGRVVSTLEGGYDLDALAASTVAHVEALADSTLPGD